MEQIEILVGLPGSGKTTYAKNSKKYTIDCDWEFKYRPKDPVKEIMDKIYWQYQRRNLNILIDGLFTEQSNLENLIEYIYTLYKNCKVILHIWTPDIEKCLHNDKYRRANNSTATINRGLNIDFDLLKNNFPKVEFIKHTIVKKPLWKLFGSYYFNTDDDFAKSESWSCGGNYGNCWDDNKYEVSGETPKPNDLLDDVLVVINPNIGFLQYKKIVEYCCEIDDYRENDYYGGSVLYNFHKIDIEKLYNKLDEFGMLPEEFK